MNVVLRVVLLIVVFALASQIPKVVKAQETVTIVVERDPGIQMVNAGPVTIGQMMGADKDGNCTISDKKFSGLSFQNITAKITNRLECMKSQQMAKMGQRSQVEKRAFFGVGTMSVKNLKKNNPEEFFIARRLMFTYAGLMAKADISRSINVTTTGYERASLPGSPEHEKFNGKNARLEVKREALAKRSVALLRKIDPLSAREAEQKLAASSGPGFVDRLYALMDATTKKLDASHSLANLTKSARATAQRKADYYGGEIEKIKRDVAAISSEVSALKAEIKSFTESIRVSEGGTSTAKLEFIGASPIYSEEYYDERTGSLHVGVVTAWSSGLQAGAIAAIEGVSLKMRTEDSPLNIPATPKVRAYISQLRVTDIIGPRRFVDNNGNHVWLGTSMVYNPGDTVGTETAKVLARELALLDLKKSLQIDLATDATFDLSGAFGSTKIELSSNATMKVMNRLSKQTFEGVENMQVLGIHPGLNMPVVISFAILDPVSVSKSRKAFMQSRASLVRFSRLKDYYEGRREGIIKATRAQIADPSARRAGFSAGQQAIQQPKKQAPAPSRRSVPKDDPGWGSYGGSGRLDTGGL
jgi:hypothetical protein